MIIALEGNFSYSAFLTSINIIKWWLSALLLTREIEFHELPMRLIFLRKEHWSVISVEFSFFLVVVFWKGNICTPEKIWICDYFYNNLTTIYEGECKMTACKSRSWTSKDIFCRILKQILPLPEFFGGNTSCKANKHVYKY